MSADTYTIKSIDKATGDVTVLFDVDAKTQVLSGAPLDDADGLKDFISSYLAAYKAGLDQEAIAVDTSVEALVGKKQTADLEG